MQRLTNSCAAHYSSNRSSRNTNNSVQVTAGKICRDLPADTSRRPVCRKESVIMRTASMHAITIVLTCICAAGCQQTSNQRTSLFAEHARRIPPPRTGSVGNAGSYYSQPKTSSLRDSRGTGWQSVRKEKPSPPSLAANELRTASNRNSANRSGTNERTGAALRPNETDRRDSAVNYQKTSHQEPAQNSVGVKFRAPQQPFTRNHLESDTPLTTEEAAVPHDEATTEPRKFPIPADATNIRSRTSDTASPAIRFRVSDNK